MKDFVFISDFDGTLSKRDFYKIIMGNYLGDYGESLFNDWKDGKMKDIEFLGKVFSSANRTEEQLLDDILNIPLDNYAVEFINEVKSSGGDFVILSAGTSYYIDRLLESKGIRDVTIISNKGVFKDNGINVTPDEKGEFYSEFYGVDKAKVVSSLKPKYKKIYYAGDSKPDFEAAKLADVAFATVRLKEMLRKEAIDFVAFEDFNEISSYLKKINIIK